MNQLEITCDHFDNIYRPIKNHFEDDAEWGGYVFVKNDPEQYAFVMSIWEQDPNRVWSYVPDYEPTFVRSGWGIYDVDGYIITDVPCPNETYITVYEPDLIESDETSDEEWEHIKIQILNARNDIIEYVNEHYDVELHGDLCWFEYSIQPDLSIDINVDNALDNDGELLITAYPIDYTHDDKWVSIQGGDRCVGHL